MKNIFKCCALLIIGCFCLVGCESAEAKAIKTYIMENGNATKPSGYILKISESYDGGLKKTELAYGVQYQWERNTGSYFKIGRYVDGNHYHLHNYNFNTCINFQANETSSRECTFYLYYQGGHEVLVAEGKVESKNHKFSNLKITKYACESYQYSEITKSTVENIWKIMAKESMDEVSNYLAKNSVPFIY